MRLCSQSLIPALEPAPDKARNNPGKKEWKVGLSSPLDPRSKRAAVAVGTVWGEDKVLLGFSRGFLVPLLDLKGLNSPQKAPEQPEDSLGDC